MGLLSNLANDSQFKTYLKLTTKSFLGLMNKYYPNAPPLRFLFSRLFYYFCLLSSFFKNKSSISLSLSSRKLPQRKKTNECNPKVNISGSFVVDIQNKYFQEIFFGGFTY